MCGSLNCVLYDNYNSAFEPRPAIDICSRKVSCSNFPDLSVIGCPEEEIEENKFTICNDICEEVNCRDESECNGYKYGINCRQSDTYVPPYEICNGHNYCVIYLGDETNCDAALERGYPSCVSKTAFRPLVVRPILNFTRCAVFLFDYTVKGNLAIAGFDDSNSASRVYLMPYCSNYIDQTNCSDPDKVAIRCHIPGYGFSTVSKMMVCGEVRSGLCESKMDLLCLKVSVDCICHKHQLCDEIKDCTQGSDEDLALCRSMTEQRCYRNYRHEARLRIPIAWLGDGTEDCLDGMDEISTNWPTCGFYETERYITETSTDCQDVFLCRSHTIVGFIIPSELCDGVETCGNENEICEMSRGISRASTAVITAGSSKIMQYCVKGLHDIRRKISPCKTDEFDVLQETIYGVSSSTQVTYPEKLFDCNHLYGEAYLYVSCLGKCLKSTPCPLSRSIKYNSCKGQFEHRVYTLVNNNHLTFVTGQAGRYTNDFFLCSNNICVEYSKVCDLVDNCGDSSDERNCTNHFACGGAYIPLSQKCDGSANCEDRSDECNDECGKQVINVLYKKIAAFGIGLLATVSNLFVMFENGAELRKCKSSAYLTNKILVMMISIGDFLTGQYLFILAVVDFKFGADFCKRQWEWLTSKYCSALGAISTIGSQTSIFALASLSLCRVCSIKNSMVRADSRNMSLRRVLVRFVLIVFPVITLATLIALAPLLSYFVDLFVNGLTYDADIKLFIEAVGKDRHFDVIQGYYGRAKRQKLKWSLILSLMRKMFSDDYGVLDDKIGWVDFYGNDGVCLFKYFVNQNDPQSKFSVTVQTVNIFCFALISVSYIFITVSTIQKSRILTKGKNPTSRMVRKRNQKMQRKIAAIIGTNFVCWIPFEIVSVLHYFAVVDASEMYGFFSIIILPINSVINPFIYSALLSKYIVKLNPVSFSMKIINRSDHSPSGPPPSEPSPSDPPPSEPSPSDPPPSEPSPSDPPPSEPTSSGPPPSEPSPSGPPPSEPSPSDPPPSGPPPSEPSPSGPPPSEPSPSDPPPSGPPPSEPSPSGPPPSGPPPSEPSPSGPPPIEHSPSDPSPSEPPSSDSPPSEPPSSDSPPSEHSPSNPPPSEPSPSGPPPSEHSPSDPPPSEPSPSDPPPSEPPPSEPSPSGPPSSEPPPSDPPPSEPPPSGSPPSELSPSGPPPSDPSPSDPLPSDPPPSDPPPSEPSPSDPPPSEPSPLDPPPDLVPSDPPPSDLYAANPIASGTSL